MTKSLQELNNVDKHRFFLTGGSDVLRDATYVGAPSPEQPNWLVRRFTFAGVFRGEAGTDMEFPTAADEGSHGLTV